LTRGFGAIGKGTVWSLWFVLQTIAKKQPIVQQIISALGMEHVTYLNHVESVEQLQ
jgi:hypothetical protein